MFCQQCGKKLQLDDAQFCPKCGSPTAKLTIKPIEGRFETLITSLFKTILIVSIVIGIFSIILGESLSNTLHPLLQEYLAQINKETVNEISVADVILTCCFLIIYFVSLIGVWKFKRWGRILYIVLAIFFLISPIIIGTAVVINIWQAVLITVSYTLDGILLAMMFTGPISKKFQKTMSVN